MLEESWGPKCQNGITEIRSTIKIVTDVSEKADDNRLDIVNGHSDPTKELEENNLQNHTNVSDRPRIRRNNLHSNNEYVYLDTKAKIVNSNPRPFNLSKQASEDNEERSFSRQNSLDCQDNKQALEELNSRRQSCNDDENTNSRRSSTNFEKVDRGYCRQYSNENKENKKILKD